MLASFPNVKLRILAALFLVSIFVGAQKIETVNGGRIIHNEKGGQWGANLEVKLELVRTIGGLDAEENLTFNNPNDIGRCGGVSCPAILFRRSFARKLTSPRVGGIFPIWFRRGDSTPGAAFHYAVEKASSYTSYSVSASRMGWRAASVVVGQSRV